jgi:hypothetical protein
VVDMFADTAEAAGLRWKWLFCWSFRGPTRPGLSLGGS